MGKKKKSKVKTEKRSSNIFLTNDASFEMICGGRYQSLDKNPEIQSACRRIAELIASMTIYLMKNTDHGDERIKNNLSRKLDISPNNYMTRHTWIHSIVMNMLLYGKGNCVVVPRTENGLLDNMIIAKPSSVSFVENGDGYSIWINGQVCSPESLLHFVYNPDPERPWKGIGITAVASQVANNLKQAAATEKAFLESKWRPSLIVKVDALIDEFSDKEGRKKLLNDYLSTSEDGEPWLIPAENFEIEQVKPLSLSDLAIDKTIELDKRTVASILGIPPFVLGIGNYDSKAWDNFISSTIKPIAEEIEQELTKKILIDPNLYVKFNMASIYSYDLKTISDVYTNLYVRGIVDGNEVRDKLSLSPRDGLDELVILENYIPLDKVGNQLKLQQEENNG